MNDATTKRFDWWQVLLCQMLNLCKSEKLKKNKFLLYPFYFSMETFCYSINVTDAPSKEKKNTWFESIPSFLLRHTTWDTYSLWYRMERKWKMPTNTFKLVIFKRMPKSIEWNGNFIEKIFGKRRWNFSSSIFSFFKNKRHL